MSRVLAVKTGSDHTRKLYLQTTFHLFQHKHPTVLLADGGSDVNLIAATYLKKMCRENWQRVQQQIQPSDIRVSSYTNDKVPLAGYIYLNLSFTEHEKIIRLKFYVIKENVRVPCPILIGEQALVKCDIDTTNYLIKGEMTPTASTMIGTQPVEVKSYYLTDQQYSRCMTDQIYLKPGEIRKQAFYLSEASPMLANYKVLLTADDPEPNILITATKSKIARCGKTKKLYALGLVCNSGTKPFKGTISATLEDANNYKTYQINAKNKDKILRHKTLLDLDVDDTSLFEYEGKFVLPDASIMQITKGDQSSIKIEHFKTEPTSHVNSINPVTFPNNVKIGQNPDSINNDVTDLSQSLTEERHNIVLDQPPSAQEAHKYHDPETAVNLGLQDVKDEDFQQEILEHKGYYIPEEELRSAKDVIADLKLDEEIRPHIEKIFGKYDNTVSTHSMMKGNLTKYLGRYKLELKPGAKLPHHRRIYYLAPTESQLMKSILEFMIKNGTIERASPTGDKLDFFSCSAFLVPRSDKNQIGRLIVDYSFLNKCLKQEPPAIPRLDQIIGQLRDSAFYTNLDLSQAFYSIELHPDSRELTRFATQFGFFNFKCLPTGVHSSPSLLERVLNHVIHYEVVRDSNGNVIWEDEENQIAKLRFSPLKHVEIFFDDILVHTPYLGSYEESKKFHFEILEKLVHRLSVHEGKLNLNKSTFFKTRLTYLGWNISHNHVSPDQRRIQKVLDFKVPETQKGWKSYLGTVSSLRLLLGFNCLRHMSTLTPLTSTKNKDKPTVKQLQAFEEIKKQLVSSPLYCSIVLPTAPKICFVDSSQSKEGSFASVLCQVIQPKKVKNYIPTYLNLADPVHQIILAKDLPCIPAPWYLGKETEKEFKSKVNIDFPPEHKYLVSPHFGLSKEQVPYTITLSLKALLIIHSCSTDLLTICQAVAADMKQGMLRQQILDFSFDRNKDRFMDYIQELKSGNIQYDKGLFFFETLAKKLQRPITVVSSLPEHKQQQIQQYNYDKNKPMFYFFILRNQYGIAVRPGYLDKEQCYPISKHRGTLEIIAYLSKTIPVSLQNSHILHLEMYSCLTALHAFKKYVGTSELLVITDAKCLWYAYNNDVQDSSTKMNRWTSKLLDNFPNLRLGFCKSQSNLCDFLSKEFKIKPPTTSMLKLPNFVDSKVTEIVDQRIFTIPEWKEFVNSKPEMMIHVETEKVKNDARINRISAQVLEDPYSIAPLMGHDHAVFAITRAGKEKHQKETYPSSIANLLKSVRPIQVLSDLLSPENLHPKQREEYREIFEKALTAPGMRYADKEIEYSIENGSLFRRKNNKLKLMIPPSLLPALISYCHLKCGHAGYHKLLLNMDIYFCPLLRTKAERFCRACLPCALVNVRTAAETMAAYPTPSEVFLTAHLDFVEALPPIGGFNHLLICTDILTGMVLLFPTKGKTSNEFLRVYLYNIQQHYSVANILADNASQFTAHSTVSTLQALGIRTIYTSSLSPMSKGNIERQVRNFKEATKKLLVSCEDYSWLLIAPYFTIMYNSSKLPRHGLSPFEMLYGEDSRLSKGVWPLVNNTPKPHPIIAQSADYIAEEKEKIKAILYEAQTHLDKAKEDRNKKLNKNRSTMELEKGDLVFVRNHSVRPGTTLPLKSRYQLSLFTVLDPGKTTALVRRELDDFVTTLHKSQLKKYVQHDEDFNDLPDDIKEVIMKFQMPKSKISDKDLITLIKYENFEVPEKAQIFHEDHRETPMTAEEGDSMEPLPYTIDADENLQEKDTETAKILFPEKKSTSEQPDDNTENNPDTELSQQLPKNPSSNETDPLEEDLQPPTNPQDVIDEFHAEVNDNLDTQQPAEITQIPTPDIPVDRQQTTKPSPVVKVTTDLSTPNIKDILPLKRKRKLRKRY